MGSTTIFLAGRYGCRVVGVDPDQNFMFEAQRAANRKRVTDRVAFRLANARDLPFDDGSFDGAVVQAVLTFTDKLSAMTEITSKVRSGGFVGVIELAWKQPPSKEMLDKVRHTLCEVVVNAETHEGWLELLRRAGLKSVEGELRNVDLGFRSMMDNEGVVSTLKIASKWILNQNTRKKIREISELFEQMNGSLGFGVYVGRKA